MTDRTSVPTFGVPLTITAVVRPWVGIGREDNLAEYRCTRRPFDVFEGDPPPATLAWPGELIPGADEPWPLCGQELLRWRRQPCKATPVVGIRTVTRSDGTFNAAGHLRRSRRHRLIEVHLQPPYTNGLRTVLVYPTDALFRAVELMAA